MAFIGATRGGDDKIFAPSSHFASPLPPFAPFSPLPWLKLSWFSEQITQNLVYAHKNNFKKGLTGFRTRWEDLQGMQNASSWANNKFGALYAVLSSNLVSSYLTNNLFNNLAPPRNCLVLPLMALSFYVIYGTRAQAPDRTRCRNYTSFLRSTEDLGPSLMTWPQTCSTHTNTPFQPITGVLMPTAIMPNVKKTY